MENTEPREPSLRKPLRSAVDGPTVLDSRIKSQRPSKFLTHQRGYPENMEDNAEAPSEETDDSADDTKDTSSECPDASPPRFVGPESPTSRSASKSPLIRANPAGKYTTSPERKDLRRRRSALSSEVERARATRPRVDNSKWKNHFYFKCMLRLVVVVVIALGVSAFLFFEGTWRVDWSSGSLEGNRFDSFREDIRRMKMKFPRQNHRSWLDIQAGVMDVMNSSSKPWTFVLFSNESETLTCLAELLGAASSRALRSENSLVLRPADMGREYGDTIDRLRPLIMRQKAVVVHDLLAIDPGAIQAFHTMCDRESPLVREAVYILTITAPGYTSSQRPEAFVENLLTDKFVSRVHEDKLQPLITRLTDGPIIPVVPANIPSGCFP